jgi:hypothetical protein
MKHIHVFLASVSLLAAVAFASGTLTRDEFAKTLPENQEDPHCRTKLFDLWTNASKKTLGAEDDEVKIRILSLPESTHVVFVRWMSADTAIAQCENARTTYLDFFIKEDSKWIFVRQYKMGPVKKSG